MSLLKNTWYAAGWSDEVGDDRLLSRQICGEQLVFVREDTGAVRAHRDRCPHRFAPLSLGRVCEGGRVIECGYHGLRFDGAGKCVHNPHGDGQIPTAAVVKTFPVVDRWSLIWVWMGDAHLANADLIPAFPFLDTAHWAIGKDSMEIDANYVLESDNILDLSHIQYLHPGSLGSGQAGEGKTVVTVEGNTVWSKRFVRDEILPDFLYQAAGIPKGELCDRWLDVRWDPPSVMYLQADMGLAGQPRESSLQTPQAHIFTPAHEGKTHYFYALAVPKAIGPMAQEIASNNVAGLRAPFLYEDKPMVEAQQRAIADRSFWEMKPVLLDIDAPAVRARRILERLIDGEREAASPS